MTSNSRSIGWWSIAALLCLVATLGVGATGSAQSVVLNSTGGTTTADGLRVTIGASGQLQIHREGSGQLYNPMFLPPAVNMYNGVFLALGSTVHGPDTTGDNLCGNIEDAFWTRVSQTSVTGTGTAASPFTSTAALAAGMTGVTLALEVSYVRPNQYVDLEVTVVAPGTNTEVVKVYHLLDTFLTGSDEGPGFVDPASGTPNVVGVRRTDVFEALVSRDRAWDHWYTAAYAQAFCQADDGADLLDTVDPSPTTDNAIGAEWNLGVLAGTVTWRYRIAFGNPSEARCGNGAVLTPEECDDGNTTDGDGCSSTCTIEPDSTCTGTTPSVCVRCLTNADCSGGTPICDVGACRACAIATQSTDCPSASLPICSTVGPTAGTCIASTDGGVDGGVDSGVTDGGSDAGADAEPNVPGAGGCGCRAAPGTTRMPALFSALGVGVLLALRRRRTSRR